MKREDDGPDSLNRFLTAQLGSGLRSPTVLKSTVLRARRSPQSRT
jgi:hypothetical protein